MDLHHHLRIALLSLHPGLHRQHGPLDDVGGGALHGGVDGGALGVLAPLRVARLDLGQVQAPAEHGLDVAALMGQAPGLLHVVVHAGVAPEVQVDVVLRLAARDAELARQPEGGHAVDQAEVDRLGGAALLVGDVLGAVAEHLGRGGAVDVAVLGEGVQQPGVARQVRHDPQLDLGVVRRDQPVALRGDEGLADAPALLGADGNVLQVRVRGRQPPRGRDRLVIGRMDAPGAGIDDLREPVRVGGLELAQAAVLEDRRPVEATAW